jgi:histidine triad (HIT) family protein
MDCIFCKIVKKEIPARIIFENDKYLAFLDITPNTIGHTLVIPKKHINNFVEQSSDEVAEHIKLVHQIAGQLQNILEADGFNVAINNGQAAGQIINHVHWHIIPRYENDGLLHFAHSEEAKNKLDETLKKINGQIK